MLITDHDIDLAVDRLASHAMRTPMIHSSGLSEALGAEVHLKCELFQPTGSFKLRGAFNKGISLTEAECARGLLAFSAGNHAMAVAQVGASLGVPVKICMPDGAVQFKIDAVRRLGADLELVDGDLVARAMELLDATGATLVHPFDDPEVVAGTATVGREILVDLPVVDTVLVPVGGGGLISGVAAAVKRARPRTRIIGVEPDSANVVSQSRAHGQPLPLPHPRSLADGLNAPVTGEINLAHIDTYVDEIVTVPEVDIKPAWREFLELSKLAAEPAAAVPLAAIRCGAIELRPGETVCMIVSGGNADLHALHR